MAGLNKARRDRQIWLTAGLLLGVAVSTALSLGLIMYENGQPAAWYASAFLACGLILLPNTWRRAFLWTGVAIMLLVSLGTRWGLTGGLVLSLMAALEARIAAGLTRRLFKTPRLANPKQALRLIFLAILPAVTVSMLASSVLAHFFHRPFWLTLGQGIPSHFLGMGALLPGALLIANHSRIHPVKKSKLETIILGVSLAIFAVAPFTPIAPFTFLLIFPAATIYAFRLGAKWSSAAVLLLTIESMAVSYAHPAPNPWGGSIAQLILIGQAFTLAAVWNGLFTTLAVNHQARIKQHLEQRTEIARRARARALKASKAKTDFLATMSHEIRTPMNGILGFTQVLLRRDDLHPEVRRQLALIDGSGAALLTVVNDILDFSKVEAGQVVLSPTPVQVSALVQETAAIVGQEVTRKGLNLALEVTGEMDQTHMLDGQRLRQVLLNLLNNAVKFTDQGGVTVRVALGDSIARFEVTDTGAGISDQGMSRLFRRFSQVDSSVSRTHGGTGLGLAICKGLVELMGGRIGATSLVGEGSTFWFEIPLGEGAALEAVEPQSASEDAVAAHILLVDDHPVNRDLGNAMLNMIGCTCDLAENGQEAVEAMKTGVYDLVLMDVHMPVMDGIAATRAIRAMAGQASRTPIVALTADILPEQVERCRAAGMVEHLSKPLKLEALIACLEAWIGRQADEDTLAA